MGHGFTQQDYDNEGLWMNAPPFTTVAVSNGKIVAVDELGCVWQYEQEPHGNSYWYPLNHVAYRGS